MWEQQGLQLVASGRPCWPEPREWVLFQVPWKPLECSEWDLPTSVQLLGVGGRTEAGGRSRSRRPVGRRLCLDGRTPRGNANGKAVTRFGQERVAEAGVRRPGEGQAMGSDGHPGQCGAVRLAWGAGRSTRCPLHKAGDTGPSGGQEGTGGQASTGRAWTCGFQCQFPLPPASPSLLSPAPHWPLGTSFL